MKTKKKWYDYLWILSLTYLILGFLISYLPGWVFCVFLSRLSYPSRMEQRDTVTAIAEGDSCLVCWAADSGFPETKTSRSG